MWGVGMERYLLRHSLAVLITLSLSLSQVMLLPPGQLLTQFYQISRKYPQTWVRHKTKKNLGNDLYMGNDLYSQPLYMVHNK